MVLPAKRVNLETVLSTQDSEASTRRKVMINLDLYNDSVSGGVEGEPLGTEPQVHSPLQTQKLTF